MSSLLLDYRCLGELIPNDYSYLAREEACKTASRNLRQHASSFLASRLLVFRELSRLLNGPLQQVDHCVHLVSIVQ